MIKLVTYAVRVTEMRNAKRFQSESLDELKSGELIVKTFDMRSWTGIIWLKIR
jgi:hypothetical protein